MTEREYRSRALALALFAPVASFGGVFLTLAWDPLPRALAGVVIGAMGGYLRFRMNCRRAVADSVRQREGLWAVLTVLGKFTGSLLLTVGLLLCLLLGSGEFFPLDSLLCLAAFIAGIEVTEFFCTRSYLKTAPPIGPGEEWLLPELESPKRVTF